MNVRIFYVYPQTVEIINELNLLRIVDKKLKESIVLYCERINNKYEIYITNTITGNINNVHSVESLKNIDELINKIKSSEEQIINLEKLEYIEQYIVEHI